MRRHDLDGLVALLTVAEKRSFTAAAALLGVTPSAISQAVKALEARAGIALLSRTTRDVAPTEAGQRFIATARPAVEDILSAFREAARLGDRPSGLLRLNVPNVVLPGLVEPLLAPFCESYPEVQVELHVSDGLANIVADGFDAGIRIGELIAADMVASPLTGAFGLAVVGAPDYFARFGRPQRPEDLKRHRCINFRLSGGGLYHWEFEEEGRAFSLSVDGPLIANSGAVMLDAARRGLGLAYVLEPVVEALCRAGELERVLEPFCPQTPGFFIYYPSRHQVMPKLRAFIDFVTTRSRQGFPLA